ncbi:MAG: tetratricopeptide repeat protein [Candidatus Schekmanbacteria bacterium]|nr:tetratricopeptide repeat protein [Candidatus Schekmanbacteria bacterium]
MKTYKVFLIAAVVSFILLPALSFAQKESANKATKESPVLKGSVKTLIEQGKFEDALSAFKQSNADESFSDGAKYFREKDYESAIKSWQKALEVYRKNNNRDFEAVVLGNIGNAYDESGDYAKAIENYSSALKISEELHDTGTEGDMLTNIGVSLWKSGDYKKSADNFEKAALLEKKSGRIGNEAFNLYNLAKAHKKLKDYDKALKAYNDSLSIYTKEKDNSSKMDVLTDIAYLYKEMGRTKEAKEKFLEIISLKDKAGDKSGMEDLLEAVVELTKTIEVPAPQKEKSAAPEAMAPPITVPLEAKISEEIIEEKKKIEVPQPAPVEEKKEEVTQAFIVPSVPSVPSVIDESILQNGLSLESEGRLDEAVSVYRDVLKKLEGTENKHMQSEAMIRLGNLLAIDGISESEDMLKAADKIAIEEKNSSGEANALCALGRYYLARKSLPESLNFFMRGEAIFKEMNDSSGEAMAKIDMGDCYFASGMYGDAERMYKSALDTGNKALNGQIIWRAKYGIAMCLWTKNRNEEALVNMLSAVNSMEDSSHGISSTYLPDRKRNQIVSDIVELLLRLYDSKAEKKYAEAAYLYSEVESYQDMTEISSKAISTLAGENFEKFSSFNIRKNAINANDEILIKYIFKGNSCFVFIITKEDLRLIKLASSKEKIDNLVDEVLAPLKKVSVLGESDWINRTLREFDLKKAGELYGALITPVENYILDKKVLLIEPTGSLINLPFELLVKKAGNMERSDSSILAEYSDSVYLLDGFSVIYAPLGVYFSEKPEQDIKFTSDFCMVGEDKDARFKAFSEIFAPEGGSQNIEIPSKSAIADAVSGCRILQFQIPANISVDTNFETGLILDEENSKEILNGDEISIMKGNSAVALFTDSEFKSSSKSERYNYLGLVSSVLSSGIKSVIYPYWKGNKFSSLELLKEFYKTLKDTKYQLNKGEALRLAKKKVRDSNYNDNTGPHSISFSHPYFWSNLVQEGR